MPGYRTSARTNGVGLPNYQGGWFRLGNGSKALVFLTDCVPVRHRAHDRGLHAAGQPGRSGWLPVGTRELQVGRRERSQDRPSKRFPLVRRRRRRLLAARLFAVASIAPVLLAGLLGGLTWVWRRVAVRGHGEGLRIRGPYGRLVPREAMDVEEARLVDLRTDPSYRVGIRTNGIGMPGYASGWFRLKGGASALLFVTDRTRAVAIPTSLGYTLLLSPADPERSSALRHR